MKLKDKICLTVFFGWIMFCGAQMGAIMQYGEEKKPISLRIIEFVRSRIQKLES